MSNLRDQLLAVAVNYAANCGVSLLRFLGDGNDGAVWESNQQTAIKAIERRDSYFRERDAYLRLQDLEIVDLQGFAVPWLIGFDDTKQIVEMTVVFPPCILAIASVSARSPVLPGHLHYSCHFLNHCYNCKLSKTHSLHTPSEIDRDGTRSFPIPADVRTEQRGHAVPLADQRAREGQAAGWSRSAVHRTASFDLVGLASLSRHQLLPSTGAPKASRGNSG